MSMFVSVCPGWENPSRDSHVVSSEAAVLVHSRCSRCPHPAALGWPVRRGGGFRAAERWRSIALGAEETSEARATSVPERRPWVGGRYHGHSISDCRSGKRRRRLGPSSPHSTGVAATPKQERSSDRKRVALTALRLSAMLSSSCAALRSKLVFLAACSPSQLLVTLPGMLWSRSLGVVLRDSLQQSQPAVCLKLVWTKELGPLRQGEAEQ